MYITVCTIQFIIAGKKAEMRSNKLFLDTDDLYALLSLIMGTRQRDLKDLQTKLSCGSKCNAKSDIREV